MTNIQINDPEPDTRWGLLYYSVGVLIVLLLLAYWYTQNHVTIIYKGLSAEPVLMSIWFAVLGSVAVALKGIADHRNESNTSFNKYDLWFIERPFAGIIVGIVTYVLLWAASGNQPQLYNLGVVSFVFGMQEIRFLNFLHKIADLILSTPRVGKSA